MKSLFRRLVGLSIALPFVISERLLSVFIGRKRAIEVLGPYITALAKGGVKHWVPRINRAQDFDQFPIKMKKSFWRWRALFDFHIVKENQNELQLRIKNCPFCEAFKTLGSPQFNPYVCEGDWAFARENEHKWLFKREHQIGTGGSYCDHTYLRIN